MTARALLIAAGRESNAQKTLCGHTLSVCVCLSWPRMSSASSVFFSRAIRGLENRTQCNALGALSYLTDLSAVEAAASLSPVHIHRALDPVQISMMISSLEWTLRDTMGFIRLEKEEERKKHMQQCACQCQPYTLLFFCSIPQTLYYKFTSTDTGTS
ncbi:hypothetical protein MHYP_G00178430 [Metynnis hypsauchen]